MPELHSIIGKMPYRLALAGGWIDQPFISKHIPHPPGSMVVVSVNPTFPFMSKCGLGTSTRQVAMQIWGDELPADDPQKLMRDLYQAENAERSEPSGSQDMAGIIFPGINRLDYDIKFTDGYFPAHIESCNDPGISSWLESVIYILPVNQRPQGYNPLGIKHLDPVWIDRLGQSGKHCFDAILAKDSHGLGESFNTTMDCWEALLPHVVRHPTITLDLMKLLSFYQSRYQGAMFSGCGGGYFYIVSDEPVPGTFQVSIKTKNAERTDYAKG
jgi:hypothetical protein